MSGLLVLLFAVALQAPPVANAQATGQISGVVVSGESGAEPVRRAVVTVSGGGFPAGVSTISDDQGRFVFSGLPAGRYTVVARKPAYLPAFHGATEPGKTGTPVLLTTGAKASIRLALHRGAVLSGTVRDAAGHPLREVPVRVISTSSVTALSSDALLTDDRGAWRAFGLAAGEYVVVVVPRLTGSAGDLFELGRTEIDARLRALEQRHGGPAALAAAPPASVAAAQPSARPAPKSIAPVYYPGTPVASGASRIRVAAGEERGGVDIALVPVSVVTVSGSIQQNGSIEMTRIRPTITLVGAPPLQLVSSPSLVGPAPDGTFSFTGVTPGRYNLVVRTGQGAGMSLPDGRGFTSNNPGVPSLYASADFDVDGRDVSGLTFALQPLPALSGQLEFSGSAQPPEPATVRVAVQGPPRPGGAAFFNYTGPPLSSGHTGVVSPGNTFEIPGILPGTFVMSANVGGTAGSVWRPRSAMLNGRDLFDVPFDVTAGSGDVSGVVVTFSDIRSELAGMLTVPADQTADRYTIVVFTEDKSLWRPGARRLRTVRPMAGGAFSIMDLPAGDYRLAAVDNTPPEDWQQASFLEQLAAASVKVTIRDGAKTTQDIKIAK